MFIGNKPLIVVIRDEEEDRFVRENIGEETPLSVAINERLTLHIRDVVFFEPDGIELSQETYDAIFAARDEEEKFIAACKEWLKEEYEQFIENYGAEDMMYNIKKEWTEMEVSVTSKTGEIEEEDYALISSALPPIFGESEDIQTEAHIKDNRLYISFE